MMFVSNLKSTARRPVTIIRSDEVQICRYDVRRKSFIGRTCNTGMTLWFRLAPPRIAAWRCHKAATKRRSHSLRLGDAQGYDAAMKSYLLPADELEYAVLSKLWDLGAASVRDVHGHIGEPEGLVYTTIAKVIDRLRGKGLIQRERHGKVFVYRARIAREEVQRARAHDAVGRLLGSAPHAAVAALVDAVDAVDPDLLDELERAVAAHRRSKRGA
jgi:predicted transcriptional regulator